MSWKIAEIPSQAGKRVLITGANSGVGYSAAVELARKGAEVVLACRDRARGEAALVRLRQDADGPDSAASRAELAMLDLSSLASVRALAEAQIAQDRPLDCLVNNAGVMAPPERRETVEGMELQFGTNVVGHFYLTALLLPLLEQAAAARVVTVASIAHKRGKIDFEDLQSVRRYSPMGAYQQSKLGDLMFAFELERRLRAAGSRVTSVAVHPGVARTELFKIGSSTGLSRLAERVLAGAIGALLNSQEGGAVPTLFAATSPDAVGGGYYGSQGFQEMRGGDVGPAKVAPQARDEAAQRRLWTVCEQLSGVNFLPDQREDHAKQ
ncbi:SDR family NAD(P)-dependent oxidoreductase [Granulicella sp. WH15]|uniref:SDR family oxidoreductase n=1 Tax=Granulicella sp. WH15 TaxID=2602070 RepID=UPI0013679116|nr:SDR family oxidoreductase [Granulicella sp. WH15]QHN02072.1 SDR family NAD(P)-dependent oxidoreductase [Granulicella sp. WH15]